MKYQPRDPRGHPTQPGSFCLDGREWGNPVYVRARSSLQGERQAMCFKGAPGIGYRGPSDAATPVGLLSLWARLPDATLKAQRAGATLRARSIAERAYAASVYRRWSAVLAEAAPAQVKAKLEQFVAAEDRRVLALLPALDAEKSARPAEGKKKGDDAVGAALRTALRAILHEEVAKTLEKNAPNSASQEAVRDFARSTAGDRDPRPPLVLAAAADPGRERLEATLEELLFIWEPFDGTAGPRPLAFNGEIPIEGPRGARVFEVAAGGGRDRLDETFSADERIVFFAHDLRRDAASLLTSDAKPAGEHAAEGKQANDADDEESKEVKDAKLETQIGDRAAIVTGDKLDAKASDIALALAEAIAIAGKLAGLDLAAVVKSAGGEAALISPEYALAADNTRRRIRAGTIGNDPPATLTSRVLLSRHLDADREYRLLVCRAVAGCDEKVTDANVAAERVVRVRPVHPVAGIALELGYGFGSGPAGGYAFERVGGFSGPTALFRLEPQDRLQDRGTFAPLLVLYPPWWFRNDDARYALLPGLAFGPTLVQGTNVSLFQQWNFRLVFEPRFARGALLTLGPSYRQVAVPRFLQRGTVVEVSGDQPPPFAQRNASAWMFTVGLAIDLTLVAQGLKAVGDLFSGKGGGGQGAAANGESAKTDSSKGDGSKGKVDEGGGAEKKGSGSGPKTEAKA